MAADGHTAAPATEPLDRRRNRTSRRIALVGSLGLGVLAAALVGGLGGGGRAALATLLLVSAAACATAALHAVATLVVDEIRERAPGRARAGVAVGLFALAAFLMAMTAGVGG